MYNTMQNSPGPGAYDHDADIISKPVARKKVNQASLSPRLNSPGGSKPTMTAQTKLRKNIDRTRNSPDREQKTCTTYYSQPPRSSTNQGGNFMKTMQAFSSSGGADAFNSTQGSTQ